MRAMTRRHTLVCAIACGFLSLVWPDRRALTAAHPHASGAVRALFDLGAPDTGPFPSNWFTVADPSHNTGQRVNLPLPDCTDRVSDCDDLNVINTLDGFNLQPRLSIPFDGPIDLTTVTSKTVFLIGLGSTQLRDNDGDDGEANRLRVIGIDQVVWDVATNTLHVESNDLLDQHTRYALIVTNGLRGTSGAMVEATEPFRRFRQTVRGTYKQALLEAIQAARHLGVREADIAVASVFTTQSVTAVLEKIRDQIKAATPKPADFVLGPGSSRTVFPLGQVTGITFNQHTCVPRPLQPCVKGQLQAVPVELSLLRIVPGAVDQVAFGKFEAPDYEQHPGEFIPPVSTRSGTPVAQASNEIYFNLFLPSGPKPCGGWPVALHGTGADGSKQRDVWLVATLAEQGIATIIINAVGRGFGTLGTLTVERTGVPSVTFPAGGRGIDQNGDGAIGNQEGQNATGAVAIISNRDAQRQTVVDYMQLVRVIEVGIDVDGDGVTDLDPSRISYFGWSFGANYGTTLLAVEPSVREGALYSLGGPIFENNRLSPLNRSPGLGAVLFNLSPPLLNTPWISVLDGVKVSSPRFFNENMPLRDGLPLVVQLTDGTNVTDYVIQSPVTNTAAGANAIQEYLEKRDWVNQSGNQVAYAPYLRRDPLAGVPSKSVLILFGKGDQNIANANATAMLRAGDLADRATYYRNDLAFAVNPAVPKNPHPFVNNIGQSDLLVAGIARFAQRQIALFLASGGTMVVRPEPELETFFEVPICTICAPLPESLNFIP
jgi:hypothetical protein